MIDIILTTYNAEKIVSACLDSIKAQSLNKYTCYVIDDASTDKTVSLVQKKYPWVKVISRKDNVGPSINRNIAISRGKNKYIAVLDSDIVLDKNWMEEQVAFLGSHESCGIVGSKLVYFDNPKKLNSGAGGLYTFGIGFDSGARKPASSFNRETQCIYACSAALLMRRSMIDKIGGFDETYFYGHEDTDLGWRANIAGYSVWSNPKANVKHRVSETMKNFSWRVYYHSRKNCIRSLIKNYELKNLIWALPVLVSFFTLDVIRGHTWAKLKGILWNIPHIFDTLRERRKVQAIRVISDAGLWQLFTPFSIKWLLGK